MKHKIALSGLFVSLPFLIGSGCADLTSPTEPEPTPTATFSLASNGVTVVCPGGRVGDTGEVGGVTYTKRSKAQITTGNAQTTCTSDVTGMALMFFQADLFNGDISSWDVSSVTDMYGLFFGASAFNQDISSWDVSSVTDMGNMFRSATAFNRDLSGWCVSNITSELLGFDTSATSWVLPRPVWGTCP